MTPELETPRLLLRPLAMEDAPQIQAIFPQWEIVRYLRNKARTGPPKGEPYEDKARTVGTQSGSPASIGLKVLKIKRLTQGVPPL